ncbi:hypothetical protein D9M68_786700 [compost metagenome]
MNTSLHCTAKVAVPSMPENLGQCLSVTPGALHGSMNMISGAPSTVATVPRLCSGARLLTQGSVPLMR